MMSHGSPADDSPQPDRPTDLQAAEDATNSSALESVLRETLSAEAEPLSDAQLDSLRQVVRTYPGEDFALQPHGIAFVRAILAETWVGTQGGPGPRLDAETLNQTACEVATTLAEVDDVWQRVKLLWLRLGEATE